MTRMEFLTIIRKTFRQVQLSRYYCGRSLLIHKPKTKCIVLLKECNMEDELIEQARDLVKKSKRISALTGAGISVDSGIPDFRSEGGLWERYDPNEYATYESFMSNPEKFWTMGQELAELLLKAKPNEAHLALAKMENVRINTVDATP